MTGWFPLTLITGLAACSLQAPTRSSRLVIEVPESLSDRGVGALRSDASNYANAPASLTDFDCFAVNVIGSGITPAPTSCTSATDLIGAAGGWIDRVSGANEVSVSVPAGTARTVLLYGVRTPDACPKLGDFTTSRLGSTYLIGTATVDLNADAEVAIAPNLDTTKTALTSCYSAPSASVVAPDYTFYISTANASTSLPISVTADTPSVSIVSAPSLGTIGATSTSAITYTTASAASLGTDSFVYRVTDANGNTDDGTITVKRLNASTWTGSAGDGLWTTAANWCGTVNVSTGCMNDGAYPTVSQLIYFTNLACTGANCNSNTTSMPTLGGVWLDTGFTGTVTMDISGGTIDSAGIKVKGGTLDMSGSTSISLNGSLYLAAGTFIAPPTLTLNGAATFTHLGGTFTHNTGSFIFNNSSAITADLTASPGFYNLQFQGTGSTALTNVGNVSVSNDLIFMGTGSLASSVNFTMGGDYTVSSSGYSLANVSITAGSLHSILCSMACTVAAVSQTVDVGGSAATTIQNYATPGPLTHSGTGALTIQAAAGGIASVTKTPAATGTLSLPATTITGSLGLYGGTTLQTGNLMVNTALTVDGGSTVLNRNGYTTSVPSAMCSAINGGTVTPPIGGPSGC